MKIVIISTSCYRKVGGVAQATWQTALKYSVMGHDVHIITMLDYLDKYELPPSTLRIHRIIIPRLSMYEYNNIDVHRNPLEQIITIIKLIAYLFKVTGLIRKIRPDIIQANSIMDAVPAYFSKIFYRIPYTLTLHLNPNATEANTLGNPKISKLTKGFLKYFPQVRLADEIISLTRESYRGVLEVFGRRSVIIPNGVDSDKFAPDFSKRSDTAESINIISIGLLYPVKGFGYAIKSMKSINKQLPQVHLTIIGDGPLYNEYNKLIDALGLSKNITLLGSVPHHDIISKLQASHLYLLSSLSEGFPLVILEGMACGLPIVSTPIGASVDIVSEWKNGIIVPYMNEDALADAIINIIIHNKVDQFSLQSINAAKTYSWDVVSNKYITLFENIVGRYK